MVFLTALFLLSSFNAIFLTDSSLTIGKTLTFATDNATVSDNSTEAEILGSNLTATIPASTTTEQAPAIVNGRIDISDYASNRIPNELEEKLASLSCDLPLLPSESRLWKGNETHQVLLPISVDPDAVNTAPDSDSTNIWEAHVVVLFVVARLLGFM